MPRVEVGATAGVVGRGQHLREPLGAARLRAEDGAAAVGDGRLGRGTRERNGGGSIVT